MLRKAAGLLPGDVGRHLLAMMSPQAIATIAVVVALWAVSHFVEFGEVVDVFLLWAGWIAVGSGAVAGIKKLVAFAISTHSARDARDLDRAAHELADALTILGIDVVLGLLFRGRPKGAFHDLHGSMPKYEQFTSVMPKGGPTAMYEARLTFTKARFAGQGGTRPTDNLATVGRNFYPEAKSVRDAVRAMRKRLSMSVVINA